jgi:hypothetical protein
LNGLYSPLIIQYQLLQVLPAQRHAVLRNKRVMGFAGSVDKTVADPAREELATAQLDSHEGIGRWGDREGMMNCAVFTQKPFDIGNIFFGLVLPIGFW